MLSVLLFLNKDIPDFTQKHLFVHIRIYLLFDYIFFCRREHLSRDAKKVLDRASHSSNNHYGDRNRDRDHRDNRDGRDSRDHRDHRDNSRRDGDRNRDREERESKHHAHSKDVGKEDEKDHERSLEKRISTAITAGMCLLCLLAFLT